MRAFAARFGVFVEPGWLGFPEALPYLIASGRRTGAQGGVAGSSWGPCLIFDGDALVGNGWKGPPVDGVAELGYSVAPARRGRGIATAVELLRCGFTRVAETVDPDDGPVWRWELDL